MLIIFTTHPIQYQVPIWRKLAARGRVPFKVLFMSDQGVVERHDPGFNRGIVWDIDLITGYDHEFLYLNERLDRQSFMALRLPATFGHRLGQLGATSVWVQGWQVVAYWQMAFTAHSRGIRTWLRGETNARSSAMGRARWLKRMALASLFSRIDEFLYIGEANRRFYRNFQIPEKRLRLAPYCVDNQRFFAAAGTLRPRRALLRENWGIPRDSFCFVFVGKFISKKRPLDIVAAAKNLPKDQAKRIHLLWIGTGTLDQELRGACRILFDGEADGCESRGVSDGPTASFIGFLNQSEIPAAYVAADCLVLPSDASETWGLVVNEAMATGLPCIVSREAGCTEDLVAPLRPDLCFNVGNISDLTNAMCAVMADPPRPSLILDHVRNYDIDRTVETVESLYFE